MTIKYKDNWTVSRIACTDGMKTFRNQLRKLAFSIQPLSLTKYGAPAGPPFVQEKCKCFPLYTMNEGRRLPDADPPTWMVLISCPDPPAVSWTHFAPLLTSTVLDTTEVHSLVSSQFYSLSLRSLLSAIFNSCSKSLTLPMKL